MKLLWSACFMVLLASQTTPVTAMEPCCTWDFATCGEDDWCNASAENCEDSCGGTFKALDPSAICDPRWHGGAECTDQACCDGLHCIQYDGYVGCGIPEIDGPPSYCCSWDYKFCSTDVWCNAQGDHCEASCGGLWIPKASSQDSCQMRWYGGTCDSPQASDNACCNGLECVQFDGYHGCGIPETDGPLSYCCSWDHKNCGGDDWCNESSDNCEGSCQGSWIHTSQEVDSCQARWQGCSQGSDCCNGLACLEFEDGWTGCGVAGVDGLDSSCCTWDFKTCATDCWCAESKEHCQMCDGATWMTLSDDTSCTARWERCESHDACCETMECVQYDGYTGCGVANVDGPPIIDNGPSPTTPSPVSAAPVTNAPTPSPTKAPTTNSPTASPTNPPTTESPTVSPTKSPTTESPTNFPTKSPVTELPTASPSRSPTTKSPIAPVASPTTELPTASPEESGNDPSPVASSSSCCSWNYKDCTNDEWCNSDGDNCETWCGGVWISSDSSQDTCLGRWDGASCYGSSEEGACCNGLQCVQHDGYQGCGIPEVDGPLAFCCSWDYKNCGESVWCNESSDNCEASCGGSWTNKISSQDSCTARWQWCDSDETCCDKLHCVQFDGYTGCGILDADGPSIFDQSPTTPAPTTSSPTKSPVDPTSSPVSPPTPEPTSSPTRSPVTADSPTDPPMTGSPTKAPTTDPPVTGSPTKAPTLPPTPPPVPNNLPTGPFIAPGYSEQVTIPQPPVPANLEGIQSNCPHNEAGLVYWAQAVGSYSPGGNVALPGNTRVILSGSLSLPLGTLTIPANSELILNPPPSGMEIIASGMVVFGKLTAGSETCRLGNSLTITLTGTRPSNAVLSPPAPSVKGIDVNGGVISLHGKRFYRTWTRLSQTVEAGSDILMLQDSINWEVGQEIVLITTAMKDSRDWHQNEVLQVAEIYQDSPTGAAIRVSSPLQHRHVATGSYQAEVGLLTRTIKIQGSAADSEPTDPDTLDCADTSWTYMRYGDPSQPCMDRELTGYGAHLIVREGGKGYIEGTEFYRVGQTNVLGRYPVHFHLLNDCPDCYLKDSSIHRSYYRCISIHATNQATVSENVAYDVSGYCYYLEDGVETGNTFSYNLAAHIHMIGPDIPSGGGQQTNIYTQSPTLTLPADVTASGFYITNVNNNIIGNTASGGWSGFAFPNLPSPVGLSKDVNIRPSSALPLTIDGNTAHSTSWWWYHTGGFYFGGALYYDNDVFTYNPGRSFDFNNHGRSTCAFDFCANTGSCFGWCSAQDKLWVRLTNTKSYLNAGVGLNSWSGRMEIIGFESHDVGLAIEALESGFWIDDMLAVCRSGEPLALPPNAGINRVQGTGFVWYDTGQAHIITDSTFRNCGYRSNEFNQYDSSPTRGCDGNSQTGCRSDSTVFGFLTHSDQFNPEIMQGTRGITMENVGRRFSLENFLGDTAPSTVSGRTQNWFDADGSVSGFGVPTILGSGYEDAGLWWKVDNQVFQDPQGPLAFISQVAGPDRGLGHVHMEWDASLHNQVGGSLCGNGSRVPCPAVGYMRHRGAPFAGSNDGLPITAAADVAGLVGGFGWYLELAAGPPRELSFSLIEVDPSTPLLFSIAYPPGTPVTVEARAAYCSPSAQYSCVESFTAVNSVDQVRSSLGNTYHMTSNGLLTFRIVMTPQTFVGNPDWFLADWDTIGGWNNAPVLERFERGNVLLPLATYGPELVVTANCGGGTYCSGSIPWNNVRAEVDSVCPSGYTQESYDRCCNNSQCVYADGSTGPKVV